MRTILYVQFSSGLAGSVHSLLLLARHVAEYNYRPVIVGQQDREGLWEEAERLGIPYYPLYLTSWAKSDFRPRDLLRFPNRMNTWRRLTGICRREGVSLIHTNLHICLDGAVVARLTGLPHVVHVRDEFSDLYRTYWGGTPGAVRFLARTSDRVIAVSESVAGPFRAGSAGEAVRVIENAIETPPAPLDCDPDAARRLHGLPLDRPVIGIFGLIAERKGQIDLVRAVGELRHAGRDLVAAIVGGIAEPAYEAAVRTEVDRLGLAEAVRFIPHQRDVWPLLRCVDVVAVPSRAEGFGRIVVEAMAAGRPVIGAAAGGIVGIIEDGANGLLVPPADPVALAGAIERLIADEPLRRRLVASGMTTARDRYSPDAHVRSVTTVYDELLDG